jgi:hypothetical protein
VVTEDQNVQVTFQLFEIPGTPSARSNAINLEHLGLPCLNLHELCDRFTEQEIWSVVRSLPPNKAPVPDGFTTKLLQSTWPIIKGYIMAAFDAI